MLGGGDFLAGLQQQWGSSRSSSRNSSSGIYRTWFIMPSAPVAHTRNQVAQPPPALPRRLTSSRNGFSQIAGFFLAFIFFEGSHAIMHRLAGRRVFAVFAVFARVRVRSCF